MRKIGAEMGEIIFDKQISGIRVVLQIDDEEYTPAEEAALWRDFVRSVRPAIVDKKGAKNV